MKRKKDDLNLQEKIEEMKKNIEDKNKEIKKYKNDNEIILNKTKIVQENFMKRLLTTLRCSSITTTRKSVVIAG